MVKPRHVPERTCAACGQKFPKGALTRIVRTPEGEILVDPGGRRAGRGAYLCSAAACWQRGAFKGGLERSLHTSIPAQEREKLLAFYQEKNASQPSSRL